MSTAQQDAGLTSTLRRALLICVRNVWFAVSLILALAGSLIAPIDAQEKPGVTLAEALQRAARQNLELQAARVKRDAAKAGIQIARQYPNPLVSFGASRDSPHESVLLDQPLELGFKRSQRIAVATGENTLVDVEISALERQVRRRTREAFYAVLLARAQSAQLADALKLSQRLQQIAHTRYEAGDVAQLEVLQADLEVARAEAGAQVAAQQQKTSLAEFDLLLNQSSASPQEPEGEITGLPPNLQLPELVQKAYESNPQIQHLQQEIHIEASRRSLLRWERLPNLDVQLGADLNAPPSFQAGLRGQLAVTVPLFSRNQGEIAQSSAQLHFLDVSLSAAKMAAQVLVESAYYDYQTKQMQAELYNKSLVPATTKLEAMAEDSYKEGRANILVVVDAQRKVSEIRRAYLDSLFSLQSSFATLEELVGAPLD